MCFKLKLKDYRLLRNLTQKQLAKLSGVSQEYISALEKKDSFKSPTLKTLAAIAAALKICPLNLIECSCKYPKDDFF